MHALVFGCGYLGSRVARRWRDAGHLVWVVTRRAERAGELAAAGLRPIVADVTRRESLAALPTADVVLYSVGRDRSSGQSLHEVYSEGLTHVLAALRENVGRLVYTSSTGVYGQSDGESVDEDSPCQPRREGGRACLAAERVLAAHELGARAIVLRLAGLYGPGRLPYAAQLRAGEPIAASGEGWLNLVHVDDAAEAVLAAAERVVPPRVLLVSDGQPVRRRDYFAELARLCGGPPPRLVDAPAGSHRAARELGNKRIDPTRSLRELGLTLRYPSYREGLAASGVDSRPPLAR